VKTCLKGSIFYLSEGSQNTRVTRGNHGKRAEKQPHGTDNRKKLSFIEFPRASSETKNDKQRGYCKKSQNKQHNQTSPFLLFGGASMILHFSSFVKALTPPIFGNGIRRAALCIFHKFEWLFLARHRNICLILDSS
jgi:hypothetical protein